MLNRVRRRTSNRGLDPIETVQADMAALPVSDATADLCRLCYSGLTSSITPKRCSLRSRDA
jgi:ubiquinone/menaquinone biosynthesis C-methylase UbiE